MSTKGIEKIYPGLIMILIILLLVGLSVKIIFFSEDKSLIPIKINHNLEDVDFNVSNGFDFLKKYDVYFIKSDKEVGIQLKLLRNNYDSLKPSKITYQEKEIIPKIIHIIWLGNKSLPQNYQYYLETWRKFHPLWEIKLWDEKAILKENFLSQDLYNQAESYAEKADIARYEILYKYGGLYVDADYECLASFDELHHKYSFYANIEPFVINKGFVQIANSMIGAVPNNPILLDTLKIIRKDWVFNKNNFLKKFAQHSSKPSRSKHHLAVQRTMLPFTEAVFAALLEGDSMIKDKAIILPLGYNMPIYPVDYNYLYKVIIRPETKSIHHYDKENSLLENWGFTRSLFNFEFILDDEVEVFNQQRHIYLNFQDLYRNNFPTQIPFKNLAQIPQIIYLNNDQLSEEMWINANLFFEIKSINDQDLLNYLPKKIEIKDIEVAKILASFYLLKEKGGVFVKKRFKPANLQEFNYKYDFYGILNIVQQKQNLMDISFNLVAAKANHKILISFIERVEEELLRLKEIDVNKLKDIYMEVVYTFGNVDGDNILFPEAIFEQKR